MTDSTWTDPDVIVQGIAGLAALVGTAVVVTQTVLTRKALREAASSRQVAEEALAIARKEQGYSALLSIEAVKSRIALHAPRADFVVDRIFDAAYAASTVPSGHPQPYPEGHIFRVTDTSLQIMIRAHVRLTNTSTYTTRFTLHEQLRYGISIPSLEGSAELKGTRPGPRDILLRAGESHSGYWEVTRTVGEWIEIYQKRQRGEKENEAELSAYVDDGLETGASYAFTVLLGGAALAPEQAGLTESWVFAGLYANSSTCDGVGPGTKPTSATYWLSRSRNIPLSEPPTEVVGAQPTPSS